jgi:hypothetical protein
MLICLFASFEFTAPGGASAAMLTTAALVSPSNSVFANPAMLARLTGKNLSFSYAEPYTIPGLNFNQIAGNLKKPMNLGLGVAALGMKDYQEFTFSVAAGFPLGPAFAYGLAVQGLYVGIAGFGADFVPAVDIGLLWYNERYTIGLVIDNLNQPRNSSGDELPVKLGVGAAVTPVENFTVSADLVKEKSYGERLLTGTKFQLGRCLALRLGLGTNPFVIAAGAGVSYKLFRVDYACRFHSRLKETHLIGFGMCFR